MPHRDEMMKFIDGFAGKKIMVVGDLMLDRFIYGSVDRISPEAPVPVVRVKNEVNKLGGSGNVVQNIKALGAEPVLIGITGDDQEAETVQQLMESSALSTDGVIKISGRPTTIKTRILAERQQVVRLDNEDDEALNGGILTKVLERIDKFLGAADAVIVSDYSKGLVTEKLMEHLTSSLEEGKLLAIDPKPSNHRCYKNAGVITPNFKETSEISLVKIKDDKDLVEAASRIFEMLNCKSLLITLGEKGMAIFDGPNSAMKSLDTRAREVFDVTGAGDTVISAFSLAKAAGADMLTAAEIANYAAGIVVSKLGTATVTSSELKEYILTHTS